MVWTHVGSTRGQLSIRQQFDRIGEQANLTHSGLLYRIVTLGFQDQALSVVASVVGPVVGLEAASVVVSEVVSVVVSQEAPLVKVGVHSTKICMQTTTVQIKLLQAARHLEEEVVVLVPPARLEVQGSTQSRANRLSSGM